MTHPSAKLAQVARFAIVSGISFTVDASVYAGLASHWIGMDASWAKRLSFACIIVWSYFAHKRFTFGQRGVSVGEPLRFAALFLVGWITNSAVHDLTAIRGEAGQLAFILATAAWACLNFLGQRFFVFRHREESPAAEDPSTPPESEPENAAAR